MSADDACWCCGTERSSVELLHLGQHPEVNICLPCAHFLHKEAKRIEDQDRSGLGVRARDLARTGRQHVIEQGWHRNRVLGPTLRWLGRYLP